MPSGQFCLNHMNQLHSGNQHSCRKEHDIISNLLLKGHNISWQVPDQVSLVIIHGHLQWSTALQGHLKHCNYMHQVTGLSAELCQLLSHTIDSMVYSFVHAHIVLSFCRRHHPKHVIERFLKETVQNCFVEINNFLPQWHYFLWVNDVFTIFYIFFINCLWDIGKFITEQLLKTACYKTYCTKRQMFFKHNSVILSDINNSCILCILSLFTNLWLTYHILLCVKIIHPVLYTINKANIFYQIPMMSFSHIPGEFVLVMSHCLHHLYTIADTEIHNQHTLYPM